MPALQYKGWPLLAALPEGWVLDKTVGSPLHGYQFVTNGKSMLNGQKRALLQVIRAQESPVPVPVPVPATSISAPPSPPPVIEIDAQYRQTVNTLARARFKQKLLADILVDLQICEIEGWSKTEYIREIQQLINGIYRKQLSLF